MDYDGGTVIIDSKYMIDVNNIKMLYKCILKIKDEKYEKTFETKDEMEEYYNYLNAYIDGRTVRKDADTNLKKREIESLIKKLEEDILSVENDYFDDIKREMENQYSKINK